MPCLAALLALSASAMLQHYATPTRIPANSADQPARDGLPVKDFDAEDDETITARADRQSRLTVPVHIEGHGPFRFMIDTGAQRTVLSTALAERLALRQGPQIRVVGIVQEAQVPSAWVRDLDLGQLNLKRMQVPLLERAHMGADGIIGTDTLQDQRVLLDFDREQIRIGGSEFPGANDSYEIVVRARRHSGQLIMTDARIDGIRVAVVIDTGAETSVGNRALQTALGRRGSSFTSVRIESVTGHTILAEVGTAERLRLGDVVVTNPAIAYTDTPAFSELGLDARPALFLGMREMRVFRRVAIDFSSRRVMFDLPG
jgi:predicted aspartyl protease